jgi:hypothetical protein
MQRFQTWRRTATMGLNMFGIYKSKVIPMLKVLKKIWGNGRKLQAFLISTPDGHESVRICTNGNNAQTLITNL